MSVKFYKCYVGETGAAQNIPLCGVLISQAKEGFGFMNISADRQQDCQRERQILLQTGSQKQRSHRGQTERTDVY